MVKESYETNLRELWWLHHNEFNMAAVVRTRKLKIAVTWTESHRRQQTWCLCEWLLSIYPGFFNPTFWINMMVKRFRHFLHHFHGPPHPTPIRVYWWDLSEIRTKAAIRDNFEKKLTAQDVHQREVGIRALLCFSPKIGEHRLICICLWWCLKHNDHN